MNRFSHFAVTKGFHPGVYSSFHEANQQIINFPAPEYQGFNSLLLANNAFEERMFCIQSDMEAVSEQFDALGINNRSPPTTPRTLPVRDGRLAPLVCYITSIPPPCFFREEVFVREGGPLCRFNVCLPGNSIERGLRAKGRFSPIEDDAKDDAAFTMLGLLLQKTGREIRDFNYLCARRLEKENFNMCQQIEALQARVEKLESGSEDSLHFATSP
ncbi:hypothetical protein PIB30_042227 [Stylosanthes scabra]|uniref:Ribonuclease H1 N-terminal domain-containing protein n=1 Tax=Stylosanthes scabra TaxID=79078 RepID=A0ABU6XDA1_9FABA|nr:hypothetical protein [Stylosanthes scabra]